MISSNAIISKPLQIFKYFIGQVYLFMSDIGFNSIRIPYQSVLFVAAADCGFTETRKCDTTPGAPLGRMMVYDPATGTSFLESDTSVCCGYVPDPTLNVEQFVTDENQTLEVAIPEGSEAPTLEEVETALNEGSTTTSTMGGVPILLVGAVGIIAIAGIAMTTSKKQG
jgi:hypothetical protein